MNPLLEVLCNEINKLKKALTTTGSDYTATVTKVEGDTAYVQIAGSDISDTPVALSVNAAEGDHVRVRVANGKAWITGNDTLPPSNDKKEVGTKMMKNMSDRDDDIIIDFGKMEFRGNTLVVDSTNFKLNEDGDATFSGIVSVKNDGGEITISPQLAVPFQIEKVIDSQIKDIVRLSSSLGLAISRYENNVEKSNTRIQRTQINMMDDGYSNRTNIKVDYVYVTNGTSSATLTHSGVQTSSDIRLKEDITMLDPATAKHLMPVQFRFKGDDKLHYGFIAQDVQKVMPAAVLEGENGYLSLTYHELIAPLYALVHEQEDRINQLEARLKALEDKK